MKRSWLRIFSLGLVALGAMIATTAPAAEQTPVKAAEGLWTYTLLQLRGNGATLPLTGVILFKDGMFMQQSVFDGEPFDAQGAMAHSGPFGPGPRGIHMVGEQTISTAPTKDMKLNFRRDSQHDISVDRTGDAMTIVFGSGTVQKFRRIGPAKGDIYKLENGSLAFVDGHFVLVSGDAQSVVTGFGTFRRKGTAYDLDVTRWSEATPTTTLNRKDGTIKASFDGKALTLADGRSFRVVPRK